MTDLSPNLSALLSGHNARLASHRLTQSTTADEFLKEAYRINSHISSISTYLQSIRQAYLTTSPPPHRHRARAGTAHDRTHLTNAQREAIDVESKNTLRELAAGIHQLESVEQLRKDTAAQLAAKKRARAGLGALGRWAAGGLGGRVQKSAEEKLEDARQWTVATHRDSVIWYLRRRLDQAAESQREMMERRLEREVERSKSMLYKTKAVGSGPPDRRGDVGSTGLANGHAEAPRAPDGGTGAGGGGGGGGGGYPKSAVYMDENERRDIEQSLTPEQLQIFTEENNAMLKHYEDTLDQVRTAERSMLEISSLQYTLATNLTIQSTHINQLVDDSGNTEENVAGGNTQLKRVTERWRPARAVFMATCGLCAGLVVWDLLI